MEKVEVYGWEPVLDPLVAAFNRIAAAQERSASALQGVAEYLEAQREVLLQIAAAEARRADAIQSAAPAAR